MVLDRQQILDLRQNFKREDVKIPDSDSIIRIRELTAGEKDKFEMMFLRLRENPPLHVRAWLIQKCVINEKGHQVFTEAELDTVASIPDSIASVLVDSIKKLSALTDDPNKDHKERTKSDEEKP